MYVVEMFIDGEWWYHSKWEDKDKANEIAMQVRDERRCEVQVI